MRKKIIAGVCVIFIINLFSSAVGAGSFYTYENQLNNNEKAFYEAFKSLDYQNKNGVAVCAEAYGLDNALSYSAFISGSSASRTAIVNSCQSGFDAAYMDNLIPFFTKQSFKLNYNIYSSSMVNTYLLYSGESSYIEGFTAENIVSETERLENTVAEIAAHASVLKKDYDKIRFVHEYLVKNVSYASSNSTEIDHTAYGALINGRSICEGYAKSLKLILNALNIDCVLVRGVGFGDSQMHMWNYVKLDGSWYLVDSTWDDGGSKAFDKYFLLGKEDSEKLYSPQALITTASLVYPTLAMKSHTEIDVLPQMVYCDLNGDGVVNAADLALLLSHYGEKGTCADINGDGLVNAADLSALLSRYGKTS